MANKKSVKKTDEQPKPIELTPEQGAVLNKYAGQLVAAREAADAAQQQFNDLCVAIGGRGCAVGGDPRDGGIKLYAADSGDKEGD